MNHLRSIALALCIIIGQFCTFFSFAPHSSFSRQLSPFSSVTAQTPFIAVSTFSTKQPAGDDGAADDSNEDSNKGINETEGSPMPPDGSKALGDYFQDDWWKDGISEGEKEVFGMDLGRKIASLRDFSDLREVVQNRLKIDLDHFLNTGKVIFLGASSRGAPERVAVIDYDIKGTEMLYNRDVLAFKDRVEELFQWNTTGAKDDFMAPYFPLIQSSGTGKTKLMHEYRKMLQTNDDKSNIHCELILCHDGKATTSKPEDSVFSETLEVGKYSTTDQGRESLRKVLNQFCKKGKEKTTVVLLFDESQHLIKSGDGWHFRSIRWWLREKRSDYNVVCVFAGTNTGLANYFAEPKESTTSRDANITYNSGEKLYPPFYEITTTGLISRTDRSSVENTAESADENRTEFDIAVPYGRPLFARMQLKGELKNALGPILLRMRGLSQDKDTHSLQQDFSILATRLQMGQVSFDFASRQIASGYAHLTHYSPEQSAVAEIAYLPDPVCAWLAMTRMIKECNLLQNVHWGDGLNSEHPSVWSEKAIKIYSSGLCRPEKGDVGEVAAAFYMLACGDELRFEQSEELTKLSVPLESWIQRLQGIHECDATASTEGPTVNFIQLCRSYLRPSLKEIQDSGLLEHWYRGARASYVYASCPAYDLLVPVKYKTNKGDAYCPMLVSVKNRASFTRSERAAAVNSMKQVLENATKSKAEDGTEGKPEDSTTSGSDNADKRATGVCMLLLIGLESPSSPLQNATNIEFSHGNISTIVIEVPEGDLYGATNLALCPTCAGGERSEVMASHADLALGAGNSFKRLLRSKTKAADPSAELLKDIRNRYNEVLQREDHPSE